jgi:uncharacterized membrane protein (UPF0127 family)
MNHPLKNLKNLKNRFKACSKLGRLFLCLGILACSSQAPQPSRSSRVVLSGPVDSIELAVEWAVSDQERSAGLMGRSHLDDRQGMVFWWPSTVHHSFWMKNTPISLDILFFSRDGQWLETIANAVPYSESLLKPELPYDMVLEVNAGSAEAWGVGEGWSLDTTP